MPRFPKTFPAYAAAREVLLIRLTNALARDTRFLAAWLIGSFGRGEEDAVSDIDLVAIVSDEAAQTLCHRGCMTGSIAPPDRLHLFKTVGTPVNIHENHPNAPPGGTFSAVLYRDPPVIVDWTLIPRANAFRPAQTRLLFDHTPSQWPELPPLRSATGMEQDDCPDKYGERLAFFWMMAMVTAKYIVRGKANRAEELLVFLLRISEEIGDLNGNPSGTNPSTAAYSQGDFAKALRALCDLVQSFSPAADAPREQVEAVLNLQ